MKKLLLLFLTLTSLSFCEAQNYTSFFIGNTNNIETTPTAGTCLMGGAGENDAAMTWFLERANGGDVLVLRATGGDGYNSYFYNDLGVTLNSVETIRLNNANAASDPYVLDKISNAEAIWFAGGNQATYVSYLKDSPAMTLLNEHINTKQAPIGGISAGMAIMGEFYFDAINGSVTSQQAMNNPLSANVSIGQGSFLNNAYLNQTITDTHFDNPNRKGRITTFLARIVDETGERAFGIAADEFTAICIDENGLAHVFGEFPQFNDIAYFAQVNCLDDFTPEMLAPNSALTWDLENEAIKVYRLPGVPTGTNTFDLTNWENGTGGTWENWWVTNANFNESSGDAIECESLSINQFQSTTLRIYPNPSTTEVRIETKNSISRLQLIDKRGIVLHDEKKPINNSLRVEHLPVGVYFLKISFADESKTIQFIKK